jgi:flagellar basal body-associated protein FliL
MSDDASASHPPKKGMSFKMILVVAAMLIVEGVVVVGVMMFVGKPSEVKAIDLGELIDPAEKLIEIPLIHERLNNDSEGRIWIWDTEIVLQVRARHESYVRSTIVERQAFIRTGIAQIWASARHHHFNEPGRVTLSRQIREMLNRDIFERDPTGEERITSVLIPKCMGFPSDY